MNPLLAGRLVVLTGAGLSTDSGIPDYRGPGSVPRQPMTGQEFRSGSEARRRYWARSFLGWPRMAAVTPNPGHRSLSSLDPELLITQNVDGLHESAGSRRMLALHGRLADVICLDCGDTSSRAALQHRLAELNPGFGAEVTVLPDGDAELGDTEDFVVAACESCGGVLKPDVVFFGENVPAARVQRAYDAVDALGPDGCLLVVGSSLTVMSGFRFVRRAHALGTPVVIVNRGETRGDPLATLKLDQGASEFLTELVDLRAGEGLRRLA